MDAKHKVEVMVRDFKSKPKIIIPEFKREAPRGSGTMTPWGRIY